MLVRDLHAVRLRVVVTLTTNSSPRKVESIVYMLVFTVPRRFLLALIYFAVEF